MCVRLAPPKSVSRFSPRPTDKSPFKVDLKWLTKSHSGLPFYLALDKDAETAARLHGI